MYGLSFSLPARERRANSRPSEMFEDGFGLRFSYYRRQRRYVGLLHGLQAAEVFQQAAGGGFSYSGDFS